MYMHTIPSPSVKTLGERRVLRYPRPPLPFSKKPNIFIHFLEWYTTLKYFDCSVSVYICLVDYQMKVSPLPPEFSNTHYMFLQPTINMNKKWLTDCSNYKERRYHVWLFPRSLCVYITKYCDNLKDKLRRKWRSCCAQNDWRTQLNAKASLEIRGVSREWFNGF